MVKVEASAIINCPGEDVWKFITDFTNSSKWLSYEAELKQTSEGPLGVGTTGRVSARFFYRDVEYDLRVTDFEPNRKLAADFTNGIAKRFGLIWTSILEVVEDGKTKLTQAKEAEYRGIWKLFQPLLVRSLRKEEEEEIAKIKRILEA